MSATTFQQFLRRDERLAAHAAYYALYLRVACGLAPDEARFLVREGYPSVRIPELRKPPTPAELPESRSAIA